MDPGNFHPLEKCAPETSSHWKPRRGILRQTIAMFAILAAGLLSRSSITESLPAPVTKAAGDALWTTMVFLAIGLLWPRATTRTLAIAAMAVSSAVEFSQFIQTDWINSIRATWLGGMAFGFGFHAADFIWYALGAALGCAIDRALITRQ